MSDPFGFFPMTFIGIALVFAVSMAISFLYTKLHDRRRSRLKYPLTFSGEALAKAAALGLNFCKDCGKPLVSFRSQDGFNPKTGEPAFSYQRACPVGSQDIASGHYRFWPFCGNTTVQLTIPDAHTHAEITATSTECPVCIDQMVKDGVLDYEQAAPLYEKAQAEIPNQLLVDMWAGYPTFLRDGPNRP